MLGSLPHSRFLRWVYRGYIGLFLVYLAAPLLVGLGVHELSAVPAVIPQLKACLAAVSLEECRALAAQALEQDTPAAVRALLARRVPQMQAALS